MHLKHLHLRNFRNFKNQQVEFPSRVSFLIGKNGQGKTNLLESVYLLCQGKSPNGATPLDLVCWEAQHGPATSITEVNGVIDCEEGRKEISYKVVEGRRQISINGEKVTKASRFFGQLLAVEFTPDNLQIAKGAPLERRRFIDRVLAMVDKCFVESSVYYEKALKSRNAILREYKRTGEVAATVQTCKQLRPWQEALVRHGRIVAEKRQHFTETLQQSFIDYHHELSAQDSSSFAGKTESPAAKIIFKSEFIKDEKLLSENGLRNLFEHALEADLRRGKTTVGIQHDDLEILLKTGDGFKPARKAASQGQTRSLVLSLKLAALNFLRKKTGEEPLLLLDDIESELDANRREALYGLVAKSESQVIVTLTEPPEKLSEKLLSQLKEAQIFEISRGEISPMKNH